MLIETNPYHVRVGDLIETRNGKTREVKRVEPGCTPECVHIDHECYDSRFTNVKIKQKN